MTTDLEAIKQAAQAATPGPWEWEADDGSLLTLWAKDAVGHGFILSCYRCKKCQERDDICLWPNKENSKFIALANPAAVLALCERMERAEEALQDLYETQPPFIFVTPKHKERWRAAMEKVQKILQITPTEKRP